MVSEKKTESDFTGTTLSTKTVPYDSARGMLASTKKSAQRKEYREKDILRAKCKSKVTNDIRSLWSVMSTWRTDQSFSWMAGATNHVEAVDKLTYFLTWPSSC